MARSSNIAARAKVRRDLDRSLAKIGRPLVTREFITRLSVRPGPVSPHVRAAHMAAEKDKQARLAVEGWGT